MVNEEFECIACAECQTMGTRLFSAVPVKSGTIQAVYRCLQNH